MALSGERCQGGRGSGNDDQTPVVGLIFYVAVLLFTPGLGVGNLVQTWRCHEQAGDEGLSAGCLVTACVLLACTLRPLIRHERAKTEPRPGWLPHAPTPFKSMPI